MRKTSQRSIPDVKGFESELRDPYAMSPVFGVSLQEFSEQKGIDFISACELHGLTPDIFSKLTQRVPCASFAGLMETLARLSGDQSFGLKYGLHITVGELGPLLHCLQKSSKMNDAFARLRRFHSLGVELPHFNIARNGNICRVTWQYSPYIVNGHQFAEMIAIILINRIFGVFPKVPDNIIEVTMMGEPPQHLQLLEEALGIKLKYHAQETSVSLRMDHADVASPYAETGLALLLHAQCEVLLTILSASKSTVTMVRQEILKTISSSEPNAEIVAQSLGMSVRTLQRKLSRSKTSFSSLLDETRRDLSTHLLRDPTLSIEQIALKVGYGGASVYSRAAKEWYGKTPSSYRKMLQTIHSK